MTLGQERVRIGFNLSKEDYVNDIKIAAAKLIDIIDQSAANPGWNKDILGEWLRLKALAMTAAEESAMWAVKSHFM